MRRTRRILALLLLAALVLLPVFAFAAEDNGGALDYGLAESRASAGTASERLPPARHGSRRNGKSLCLNKRRAWCRMDPPSCRTREAGAGSK